MMKVKKAQAIPPQLWVIHIIIVLVLLTAFHLLTLMNVRRLAGFEGFDPYWIDYNAPGVDITSEGPDNGDPWYEIGGETDADPDTHL